MATPRSSSNARLAAGASTAAAAAMLLGACAGTGGFFSSGRDWPAFAADVYTMPAAEREVLQEATSREHSTDGSADAAIRLAILTATPDASEQDLGVALDLLDMAEAELGGGSGGGGGASRDFIVFFRPLVLALQTERSRLAAESLTRQSLEAQLEELKALEEALNGGSNR